jgi:hypothetical protein
MMLTALKKTADINNMNLPSFATGWFCGFFSDKTDTLKTVAALIESTTQEQKSVIQFFVVSVKAPVR